MKYNTTNTAEDARPTDMRHRDDRAPDIHPESPLTVSPRSLFGERQGVVYEEDRSVFPMSVVDETGLRTIVT